MFRNKQKRNVVRMAALSDLVGADIYADQGVIDKYNMSETCEIFLAYYKISTPERRQRALTIMQAAGGVPERKTIPKNKTEAEYILEIFAAIPYGRRPTIVKVLHDLEEIKRI